MFDASRAYQRLRDSDAQRVARDMERVLWGFWPRPPAQEWPAARVGAWVVVHFRRRAKEVGYGKVAAQLRKQGYPLEQALLMLLGCEVRA